MKYFKLYRAVQYCAQSPTKTHVSNFINNILRMKNVNFSISSNSSSDNKIAIVITSYTTLLSRLIDIQIIRSVSIMTFAISSSNCSKHIKEKGTNISLLSLIFSVMLIYIKIVPKA